MNKLLRLSTLGILCLVFVSLLASLFLQHVLSVQAATNHVVISQIQLTGTNGADDEFIELYNPTASDISLSNWRLGKDDQTSSNEATLVASMSGTIKAHGYFLITSQESSASGSADLLYANNSITPNNAVVLYSDAGSTRVDLVGMGTSVASESADAPLPGNNESILRKANANATAVSMTSAGTDQFAGNGYDDDNNNANDFVLLSSSMPRNSTSPQEPPLTTPTPTPSLTPTPTLTPSDIPTDTPTDILTNTPSPTPTDTSTPTSLPSPTETLTPTPTETPTDTPTMTPTGTITPSPTFSPTPNHRVRQTLFPEPQVVCTWKAHVVKIGRLKLTIPYVHCGRVKSNKRW